MDEAAYVALLDDCWKACDKDGCGSLTKDEARAFTDMVLQKVKDEPDAKANDDKFEAGWEKVEKCEHDKVARDKLFPGFIAKAKEHGKIV